MKNRGNVISPQLFAAESLTHTGYYFKIGIVAPNYFGMTVPGFSDMIKRMRTFLCLLSITGMLKGE